MTADRGVRGEAGGVGWGRGRVSWAWKAQDVEVSVKLVDRERHKLEFLHSTKYQDNERVQGRKD